MGKVQYQALPLLQFFAYKIRSREKVRKGEGEPGDEARCLATFNPEQDNLLTCQQGCKLGHIVTSCMHN